MRQPLLALLVALSLLLAACQPAALPAPETTQAPANLQAGETPTPALPLPSPTSTPTPVSAATTVSEASPVVTATGAAPTVEITSGCTLTTGTIITESLESALLPAPLDYRIYRPPCFGLDPAQRYPVLYLLHGLAYTDDQWDRLGVDETADRLISKGEIAPFLIVMPYDRRSDEPPYDPFEQAFIQDLVPWVDTHYPTLPDRKHRAIGGLSRGASWAVHLGLTQWKLFGTIGGHSLPVFPSEVDDVPRWLDAIPRQSLPRIYLDVGDRDGFVIQSAIWFQERLTEMGIPHEWHLFRGTHEEAYWQSHLEQYLRFYAEGW